MNKIKKLQKIYGKDRGTATLEETSKYLKSIGYDSLAELLTPGVKG